MSEFTTVPIVRGFMEISHLYKDVTELGGIICGGYVRYCCSPRPNPVPGSDVDIYCKTDEVYDALKNWFQMIKLESKHENDICITYKRPKEGTYAYAPPIQLIKPIREGKIVANGTMEEILSNFDFSVIRIGILSPTTAMADKDFLEDEKKMLLRLNNIHCPISSTMRCMKYAKKGYWIRPYEVLKLFSDWESRSDSYRMKVADFLTKSFKGGKDSLTKKEVEELEALLKID